MLKQHPERLIGLSKGECGFACSGANLGGCGDSQPLQHRGKLRTGAQGFLYMLMLSTTHDSYGC